MRLRYHECPLKNTAQNMCLSCECAPLPPSTYSFVCFKPTIMDLLDHVVYCVPTNWYHFGLALRVEDYLLEDIKATERSEVEVCYTDMLRRCLRVQWATGGELSVASDRRQLGALLGHCRQHSELSCADWFLSTGRCVKSPSEVQGIG